MELYLPITKLKLLELYYYDKVWEEGMPFFDEIKTENKEYMLDSFCFGQFVNSERALELHVEMLEMMN